MKLDKCKIRSDVLLRVIKTNIPVDIADNIPK